MAVSAFHPDTFIVRSLLVPALVLEIGDRVWWPSALARTAGRDGQASDAPGGWRWRPTREFAIQKPKGENHDERWQ
jgi:hypothetical protein